ncbi:hypothetical protein [Pyxidicoccus caerfyrddinensis]|jgi:hypothetical protein|uniref:hypothetical protein n=1 Tax=Pyxidicoccus caerfyrddinensis TaxID=2709663 RepID=UPI0013D9E9ED|nr:hypothetical protein [Pyxidicoccus caerfyrddinensis]
MALFATVTAEVECPRCGVASSADWQFYLGAVGDMPHYAVGDVLRWEGTRRQTYGSPEWHEVIAVGYMAGSEWCGSCRHPHALADIHVRENRIERVTFRSFEPWIPETLFVGPERKPV